MEQSSKEVQQSTGSECSHQGGSFAIMNENIGDILPETKRCTMLQ